ncbi:hypothetical protein ES705_43532 [subsurface metagenome]
MIKIKKIKHSKVILIFVAIFLLVLFIGNLSRKEVKSETYPSITMLDINEKNKFLNAAFLDALLEKNALPKNIETLIKSLINGSELKTTKEVIDEFGNVTLIEWILAYKYSVGYRINCVIGDWIILVNE